jgi:hypothetical protein
MGQVFPCGRYLRRGALLADSKKFEDKVDKAHGKPRSRNEQFTWSALAKVYPGKEIEPIQAELSRTNSWTNSTAFWSNDRQMIASAFTRTREIAYQ